VNGIHDMGGMHGFGPVLPEENEPVFHETWEGRVFGLRVHLRERFGDLNIDYRRHQIERLRPDLYLQSSYYQRWLETLLKDCVRNGLIDETELQLINRGRMPPARAIGAKAAPPKAAHGYARAIDTPPAFKVGDQVRGRNLHVTGHTRIPRYARGKQGVIVADHAGFVFPDANAALAGENPQRLYTVKFTARELWGDAAHAKDTVRIDLWESYLEPAA
jgi:nitrile hydratase subunit beta